MTQNEMIASFAHDRSYADLSPQAILNVKIHLLDSLGCAIGALVGDPVHKMRDQINEFGGNPMCTMIGGGKTSPDRAAMFNTALTRYLDFMDNFLAKGETCHPSDNIGSLLTAAEYADRSGKDLIGAIAIAYQIECRITEEAPIMQSGFDHTTQLAISIPAVVSKLLGFDKRQTMDAIGICAAEFGSLAVTRAVPISQWKGLASASSAFGCVHNTFLAKRGISGPVNVFEGVGGLMQAIDKDFHIDWETEDVEIINKTLIKRYNAEAHTQSCLEGVLELREEHHIDFTQVAKVDIDIFKVAYSIVGGGKYGPKKEISTKEQADHSLPYLVAVALIDGEVTPAQFETERVRRVDVQQLLQHVYVDQAWNYTHKYPDEMGCHIRIKMKDGTVVDKYKTDYYGFWKHPVDWPTIVEKYNSLCTPAVNKDIVKQVADMVYNLENISVKELMQTLAGIKVIEKDYAPS
jgi:2-methylcitrate dehydratase